VGVEVSQQKEGEDFGMTKIISEKLRLRGEGKTECGRCLRIFALEERRYKVTGGLCDKCLEEDQQRKKDQQEAKAGKQSSSEQYELREDIAVRGTCFSESMKRQSIADRNDARWYKKAGSNGDG
jgi:hypothetical protein